MHKFHRLRSALMVALLCGFVSLPLQKANAIAFDFTWTGTGGYSVVGVLSYSDTLIGTGPIDETGVQAFVFDVLQGGAFQGTWSKAAGIDPGFNFNFNFDTTSEAFVVGGISSGTAGQLWNSDSGSNCAPGSVGFGSGNGFQADRKSVV